MLLFSPVKFLPPSGERLKHSIFFCFQVTCGWIMKLLLTTLITSDISDANCVTAPRCLCKKKKSKHKAKPKFDKKHHVKYQMNHHFFINNPLARWYLSFSSNPAICQKKNTRNKATLSARFSRLRATTPRIWQDEQVYFFTRANLQLRRLFTSTSAS